MNKITEYIDGTVDANLKKVMVGDDAVLPNVAKIVAREAAGMAVAQAIKGGWQTRRLSLACGVAGHLAYVLTNNSTSPAQDEAVEAIVKLALRIVDRVAHHAQGGQREEEAATPQ